MFRKLKKTVLLSMAVSIAVTAAIPMSAFAQRFNFYQEDLHGMYDNYIVPRFRRVNGDWPVGWISKFTAINDIDTNNYYLNQPVTDVITADRYLLPTSKAFINKVGSACLGNAYYIFDTVGTGMYDRKYIALDEDVCGSDKREVYYVRWIMYVPNENYVENKFGASRMTLALHSSYKDNDDKTTAKSRYEAGVHYKYDSNGNFEKAELMFFQRGNPQGSYQSNYPNAYDDEWTYASDATGIQTGNWYNCLLKISAVQDSYTNTDQDANGKYTATNTAEFKMWKYGADEPDGYTLTCTFKPKHGQDNIVILRPYAYGISGNVLNGVSDFQVDGYTDDDISNAEAVFAAAQAWNPNLAALSSGIDSNNIDDLNTAMNAAVPTAGNGVTVTYALNRPNDAYLSVDAQSGTFTLNSSPKHWREYALEATFTKDNAVTRKSYPIGVRGALNLSFDTEQRGVAGDGKYQCKAVVKNESNSISIKPAVILASYDSTGRIIGELHGVAEHTIDAGNTWSYNFTGLNIEGAVKVRAFLWNGIDDPTPLCDYEETSLPLEPTL